MSSRSNGISGAWGAGQLVDTAEDIGGSILNKLSAISGSPFGLGAAQLFGLKRDVDARQQLMGIALGLMNAEARSIEKVIRSMER